MKIMKRRNQTERIYALDYVTFMIIKIRLRKWVFTPRRGWIKCENVTTMLRIEFVPCREYIFWDLFIFCNNSYAFFFNIFSPSIDGSIIKMLKINFLARNFMKKSNVCELLKKIMTTWAKLGLKSVI